MSLLQMSFSGSVLILTIIVVRAVAINKLPKKMFLFLWGITLVRLLIPFTISSPASVYSLVNINASEETLWGNLLPIMPEEQMEFIDETEQVESMGEAGQTQVQLLAEQTPYVSVWQVSWCIGAVFCIAFFALFYLCWILRFRRARSVHNRFVKQWIKDHRSKRPISIRQSDRIDTPLTYGIFHPVILMPEDTNWEDIEQLQYILQHEYVHICRFDTVTKLICALAVSIHWFNPFVWVMYLLFNRDLELSCDERVVRQFGVESRKAYASVLISMEAKKSGVMPFYNNFSKNAIEERIISIMKTKKTSIFAIFIAVILFIGITSACATSATKPEDNGTSQDTQNIPDSNTENSDNTILTEEAGKELQEYLSSINQWDPNYVLVPLDTVLGEIENQQMYRFEVRYKDDTDEVGGRLIDNYAVTADGERIFWYNSADGKWVSGFHNSENGTVDTAAPDEESEDTDRADLSKEDVPGMKENVTNENIGLETNLDTQPTYEITNGNTGKRITLNDSQQLEYIDALLKNMTIQKEESIQSDAERTVGYLYCIRVLNGNGDVSKTITLNGSRVEIDGKYYIVESTESLVAYLDDLYK